jgi:hypothetical protein
MHTAPDDIADSVLTAFEQLPANRKPVIRANGVHEWVPLSGIVAEGSQRLSCRHQPFDRLTSSLSIAEGGKLICLTLA